MLMENKKDNLKSINDFIGNIEIENDEKDNFNFEDYQINKYNNTKIESKVYECQKCGNKGMIAFKNKYNLVAYKKCECYELRKNREKMKEIGLLDFISTTYAIENLQPQEEWEKRMIDTAYLYFDEKENYSIFYGGAVGGGKTTICANIMSKKIEQNPQLMADYILWDETYRDLDYDNIQNTTLYYEKKTRFEYLKNVGILFIDDFLKNSNKKGLSDLECKIAKAIIDYRYRNKLITIISSELYMSEIMELDEAIGSRIYEMCCKGKYVSNIKKEKDRNHRNTKRKTKTSDEKKQDFIDLFE